MKAKRKAISAQLPKDLLEEACRLGNLNQTDALIMGLQSLIADFKRKRLATAGGKFHFSFNPDRDRQRTRL